MIVVLDSGPLGLLAHPASAEAAEPYRWLHSLEAAGVEVWIPEIADYELRRELLRIDAKKSLQRLDELIDILGYIPLSTSAMRKAAEFWASSRKGGRPTADDKALDGDMILAAQATLLSKTEPTVIATTNVKHLSFFAPARLWHEITPEDG